MIIEEPSYHNKLDVFSNRQKAGNILAKFLQDQDIDLILAIPNGGIPVAYGLIKNLNIPDFNLLLIRKIQIPWNTEAGFGAITPDGQVFLNQKIISHLQLQQPSIQKQIESAKKVNAQRQLSYNLKPFQVKGKRVLVTDDGIASGFSMIAGCSWLKQQGAQKVIIGIPTAPISSLKIIEKNNVADSIICINLRDIYPFAVADAYKHWYDVPEEEVVSILENINKILLKKNKSLQSF
jgi:predicted phosphoribosyltransferase